MSALPTHEARQGAYVAIAGGGIAFVCSLLGFIPDRRSVLTAPERDPQPIGEQLLSLIDTRSWATFLQSFGLVVGGLLILVGGVAPWLQGPGATEGIELARGRVTFGLGALIGVLGLLRLTSDDARLRNGSAVLAASSATAVLSLSFYELDRLRALTDPSTPSLFALSIGQGLYYTIIGGPLAIFGSLFGLIPERSPSA